MRTITKKVIDVNGVVETLYNEEKELDKVLRNMFETQGNLYEEIFWVSKEDAYAANWHPGDMDFSCSCQGWRNFLVDKGRIQRVVITSAVPVKEIIEELMEK